MSAANSVSLHSMRDDLRHQRSRTLPALLGNERSRDSNAEKRLSASTSGRHGHYDSDLPGGPKSEMSPHHRRSNSEKWSPKLRPSQSRRESTGDHVTLEVSKDVDCSVSLPLSGSLYTHSGCGTANTTWFTKDSDRAVSLPVAGSTLGGSRTSGSRRQPSQGGSMARRTRSLQESRAETYVSHAHSSSGPGQNRDDDSETFGDRKYEPSASRTNSQQRREYEGAEDHVSRPSLSRSLEDKGSQTPSSTSRGDDAASDAPMSPMKAAPIPPDAYNGSCSDASDVPNHKASATWPQCQKNGSPHGKLSKWGHRPVRSSPDGKLPVRSPAASEASASDVEDSDCSDGSSRCITNESNRISVMSETFQPSVRRSTRTSTMSETFRPSVRREPSEDAARSFASFSPFDDHSPSPRGSESNEVQSRRVSFREEPSFDNNVNVEDIVPPLPPPEVYGKEGEVMMDGVDFTNSMASDFLAARQSPADPHLALGRPAPIPTAPLPAIEEPDVPAEEPKPKLSEEALAKQDIFCSVAIAAVVCSIIIAGVLIGRARQDFNDPTCVLGATEAPPDVCKACGSGLLVFPIGGEWELAQSTELRACLYFVGLVWCFIGVSIVCDMFMESIEQITSFEVEVWKPRTQSKVRFALWNPTIANLSLMALGSSAPEILLSSIELARNEFFAGELGPSTIVGSAAFNLLMITSVCISAVPRGTVKKIANVHVFAVTATVSMLAYLWLLIILVLHTPDMVDVGEAVITLFMFVAMLVTAFAADKGWLSQLTPLAMRVAGLDSGAGTRLHDAEVGQPGSTPHPKKNILRQYASGKDILEDVDIEVDGTASESTLSRSIASCSKVIEEQPTWVQLQKESLYCNGSPEDQQDATKLDWTYHIVTLFWKMLFVLIPSPGLGYGWPCFIMSLVWIGAITAIVGDMAEMLGCCLGIPSDITAITLVALGTSVPDMMASRTAARSQESADDAIGNVTGSNAVNVFLGLGLPWTVGALYWHYNGATDEWKQRRYHGKTYQEGWGLDYPDGGFLVPAGSLSFSVGVFCTCGMLCLGLLVARRRNLGGELGGTRKVQNRDSLILAGLWIAYIASSCCFSIVNKS